VRFIKEKSKRLDFISNIACSTDATLSLFRRADLEEVLTHEYARQEQKASRTLATPEPHCCIRLAALLNLLVCSAFSQ